MEVLALLLLALLLPAIAIAVAICICAALFLTPVILLTLPVAIPMRIFFPDGKLRVELHNVEDEGIGRTRLTFFCGQIPEDTTTLDI